MRSATVSTLGELSRWMATPPQRPSESRSSLSQRGLQPRGSQRSDTTMSTEAQVCVNVRQSIRSDVRMASRRHSRPSLVSAATHESREQWPSERSSSAAGSPSNPAASANKLRT